MTIRRYTAFVSGTITNNPLTSGGTTLNSAGLSALATIVAPDIAVIILDPAGVNGAPEVVYVTAHSSAATSATITRAQESSSAREHPSGTPWVHGPTTQDFGIQNQRFLMAEWPRAITSTTTLTPDANKAYLYPMEPVLANCTVTAISTNMSTSGGNIDLGIYEWDGTTMTKIASTGSIASPGTGLISTALSASLYKGGDYYFAFAADSTTPRVVITNAVITPNIPNYYKASSFPLPSTITSLSAGGGNTAVFAAEISNGLNIL